MDARNVKILPPYPDEAFPNDTIYIDEAARYALHASWGDRVKLVGRREFEAKIAELRGYDQGAQICRMNDKLMDAIFSEIGDQLLLYNMG